MVGWFEGVICCGGGELGGGSGGLVWVAGWLGG